MLIDPVDYLLTQPAGSACTAMTPNGVAFLIREDKEGLRAYYAQCSVEIRLAARPIADVLVVALMCRLGGRDSATFESWLNLADPDQAQSLASLTCQSYIDVHIYVGARQPARSLRSPNGLRRGATAIIEALPDFRAWPMQAFDRAKAAWQADYPTVQALWASLSPAQGGA